MRSFIYHFNSFYFTRETHFSLLVLLTVEKSICIFNLCSESMSVFVFVRNHDSQTRLRPLAVGGYSHWTGSRLDVKAEVPITS